MKPQTSQVLTTSGMVFTQKENAAFRSLFSGPVSIDADLPFANDIENDERYRSEMTVKHGITTVYSDVWRQYHATAEGYCGAPDSGDFLGTGDTSVEAIDSLVEQLENETEI